MTTDPTANPALQAPPLPPAPNLAAHIPFPIYPLSAGCQLRWRLLLLLRRRGTRMPLCTSRSGRGLTLYGCEALVLGGFAPSSSMCLLDVACGAGDLALAATALGFEVTATDLSAGMISQLHHKLRASISAVTSKITPCVIDGQTLDGLHEEVFDVVSSVFGISLFPDRVAAWSSATRVLVPGGRLLAASWDANSINVRMVRYLMENAQDKVDAVESDSPLQNPGNQPLFAALFREELAECGYEDITIHAVSHPMCFRSGKGFVLGVLDNSAFIAMTRGKIRESVQRCVMDYAQLVLNGVDPFGEDAPTTAAAFCTGRVETHPLPKPSRSNVGAASLSQRRLDVKRATDMRHTVTGTVDSCA